MKIISVLLQAAPQETGMSGILLMAAILVIAYYLIIVRPKKIKQKEDAKRREARKREERFEQEKSNKEEIDIKLNSVDELQAQLSDIQLIQISEVSDLKKIIYENEKEIIEKGGDNQLHLFIKIDSFLHDFRNRIIKDQDGLKEILDISWLKKRIIEESKRDKLEKINENFNDLIAVAEGNRPTGFDYTVDNLFKLGNVMKPSMEKQIKTMDYYHSISIAMLVYYMNDKKIRYFEIYEAFEKLGVFDSTWQKNVLNKLDRIETRLSQLSNQLTELNRNFMTLVESSENIVTELKEINNSIMTNNLLQAITAYQTYKINKNTKSEIELKKYGKDIGKFEKR